MAVYTILSKFFQVCGFCKAQSIEEMLTPTTYADEVHAHPFNVVFAQPAEI